MTNSTLNLTPELYQYLIKNGVRAHPVMQKLRDATAKMSMKQMQISPEQGQFMQFLVEIIGAKKTLEVGVFTGYSALAVALALPDDGKITALDINVEWTKLAKKYWAEAGVEHKIDLRLAPALESLAQLIEEGASNSYDFAFIDADKNNYPEYYELALQLVKVGGVIAIDNTLWAGKVADPSINDSQTVMMRKLNSSLASDDRVHLSLLPISDGLTLLRKC